MRDHSPHGSRGVGLTGSAQRNGTKETLWGAKGCGWGGSKWASQKTRIPTVDGSFENPGIKLTSWGEGSWNLPFIYKVFIHPKRWLFGISEPSTVSHFFTSRDLGLLHFLGWKIKVKPMKAVPPENQPKNGCLEDVFPFLMCDFQVPC